LNILKNKFGSLRFFLYICIQLIFKQKNKQMKKVLALAVISLGIMSCGSNSQTEVASDSTAVVVDTAVVATDSAVVKVDSAEVK
jgi:hypothetical protein